MRTYWFLVRDEYAITWLTDYVDNLKRGLESLGESVKFTTRSEVSKWSEILKPKDVLIITDFDDMDLVESIPDWVITASHGHGVALSWIACNWEGEIEREKFFYDHMDIVTLNTPSQKMLIEKELDSHKCQLQVIGYPIDYDKIMSRTGTRAKRGAKKKILVAQRWDWDAQQMLCMEALEPFIDDPNIEVSILTPTPYEYCDRTVGKDTLDKWKAKCNLKFRATQEDFWREAQTSDVFFSTGNHHTLNLSLIEAYLFGCEAVLPRKYPYTDFVNACWWYRPYDLDMIQNSIRCALQMPLTRIELGKYDYRTVARKFVEAVKQFD